MTFIKFVPGQRLFRLIVALLLAILWLIIMMAPFNRDIALARPGDIFAREAIVSQAITLTITNAGDPLDRIQCSQGYTATIYAEGLSSPHGLALNPAGVLYASESSQGRVSQIGSDGVITPVITGLSNPEGLAFDNDGKLYVVEDIDNGRVVTRATNGTTATLVTGLDGPEDVIWVDDGSPLGILYVTESNLEDAVNNSSNDPDDYQTYLTAISLAGVKTRILTTPAEINVTGPPIAIDAVFWSYAGVAVGPDGLLYLINELSGRQTSGTYLGFPYQASSTDSVFTVNPEADPVTRTAFADDQLIAPEGLHFSADGNFPLYIVEEDTGSGEGRLSQVDALGNPTTFCTGFSTLEDVAVGQDGSLYVAEDTTGLIIRIHSPGATPPSEAVWLPIISKQP
jgi:sugar lactone lactonase YvrE